MRVAEDKGNADWQLHCHARCKSWPRPRLGCVLMTQCDGQMKVTWETMLSKVGYCLDCHKDMSELSDGTQIHYDTNYEWRKLNGLLPKKKRKPRDDDTPRLSHHD